MFGLQIRLNGMIQTLHGFSTLEQVLVYVFNHKLGACAVNYVVNYATYPIDPRDLEAMRPPVYGPSPINEGEIINYETQL